MSSPLSVEHADMENNLSIWAGTYRIATPGCASGNNATNLLLGDCPQPDVNLRIIPEFGGKSRIRKKLLFGPAEMLVEVSSSSASMDLHQKFDLYEEAGVSEYLVVIVNRKELRWFRLANKKFKPIEPEAGGVYRSVVFPGHWHDSKALFKDNMAKVLATLQQGIDSDEHQRFIAKLAARKK